MTTPMIMMDLLKRRLLYTAKLQAPTSKEIRLKVPGSKRLFIAHL
jgi:hypothetical protein